MKKALGCTPPTGRRSSKMEQIRKKRKRKKGRKEGIRRGVPRRRNHRANSLRLLIDALKLSK